MTRITSLFIALSAVILLASCGGSSDYKKTKSGILYKIISTGNEAQVKKGEWIKADYVQKINDSVLGMSYGKLPAYVPIDSVGDIYDVREVFPFLHKGDSVEIVQMVDTFMKKNPGPLPPFMKKGDKMILTLKVRDVYANEQAFQADRQAEAKKETDREVASLEALLVSKKINAQKIGTGTFVTVETPGDGPAVDSGKYVSVKYRGKLLDTGKEFETNMDAGKEPYSFVIGQHAVIQGWDEGLKAFKKGGKGTLYIPGFLAYGPQPGPGGKPNEGLIFDVEIVDVKDKAPAQPAMPGQGQGQGQPVPQGH